MLGEEVHPKNKLAHYAQACADITFKFPFGNMNSKELLQEEILTLLNIRSTLAKTLNTLMRVLRDATCLMLSNQALGWIVHFLLFSVLPTK